MKITKFVDTHVEVEIEIDVDDIVAAITDTSDALNPTLRAIQYFHRFMEAATDETIKAFTPEQRQIIREFFEKLAARFSDDS